MVQLIDLPKVVQTVEVQSLPFAVEYSVQHFSCSTCSSDDFSLNAPKFVFSNNQGVATFNLPPMTGRELGSLSLFFSTSASFPCAVVFDHIPGFQVIASVLNGSNVKLRFQAAHEILHFMGQDGSANLLTVSLSLQQLDALADQVLASASTCN
jgi:hypothetical protein